LAGMAVYGMMGFVTGTSGTYIKRESLPLEMVMVIQLPSPRSATWGSWE